MTIPICIGGFCLRVCAGLTAKAFTAAPYL